MRKAFFVAAGLCLTAGLLAIYPSLALAADAQGYAIDTGPLVASVLPLLEAALFAVVTVATGWLSRKANQYLGVQLDAKHRAALNEGAASLINQILVYATQGASRTYYTKSQILSLVASGLITKFPDAIKHFGLTSKEVEAFVLGRLDKLTLSELSGEINGAAQDPSAAIPKGYPSAPVDLSQAVAGSPPASQAGG